MHRTVVALLAAASLSSSAAAQQADSTRHPPPAVSRNDVYFLLAGTAATLALSTADPRIARTFTSPSVQNNSTYRGVGNFYNHINETTLMQLGALTYVVGRVAGWRTFTDIVLHTTESVVLTSGISQAIRGPLGRSRPSLNGGTDQYSFHFWGGWNNFKYRAFPSLHSSSTFAAAGALVSELRERGHKHAAAYIAPIAFVAALGPGLARMRLNQHWASDVLMGGVIGSVTGLEVVKYMHERPDNAIDRVMLPKKKSHLMIAPALDGGVSVMYRSDF